MPVIVITIFRFTDSYICIINKYSMQIRFFLLLLSVGLEITAVEARIQEFHLIKSTGNNQPDTSIQLNWLTLNTAASKLKQQKKPILVDFIYRLRLVQSDG